MEPVIDHIQVTVKDIRKAEEFYDRFLPLLGFDLQRKVSARIADHDLSVIEYNHDKLAFALSSPRTAFQNEEINRRKPGALHHLAFRVATRQEVDEAYKGLCSIGAVIVAEPGLYPEYGPNYYAVYFKDLENIKYEIVCTASPD